MALIYRTSSAANVGPETIKNSALTYEEGDGNFAYLLTNMSGSNINITGDTTLTGQLQLDGNVFLSQLTSASQNSILTYNDSSGRVYFTSSANFATVNDLSAYVATSSFNSFTSSYSTGSFTGSFTGQLIGTASQAVSASWAPFVATNTGSLLTTASVSNNTITFTKGDGSTFPITVVTGSGGGATPGGSNTHIQFRSGSVFAATSSFKYDYSRQVLNQGFGVNEFIDGGIYSHAQGDGTYSTGNYSHAEGGLAYANGMYSHAEGYQTTTYGTASHAEGNSTKTGALYAWSGSWRFSHVTMSSVHGDVASSFNVGDRLYFYTITPIVGLVYTNRIVTSSFYDNVSGNTILGVNSSIGSTRIETYLGNIALDPSIWSGGGNFVIPAHQAHSEGNNTTAIGEVSHTEGEGNVAYGRASHAEGAGTQAIGPGSHTEGYATQAIGDYSHTQGLYTVAAGTYQSVVGQYNVSSSAQSAFVIGNGTNNSNRRNLLFASGSQVQVTGSIDISGSGRFTDGLNVTGSIAVTGSSFTFNGASVPRPYKVYTALVSFNGSFTVSVLENNLGQTITWSNPGNGIYRATSTGTPFTEDKTFITSTGASNGQPYTVVPLWDSGNIVDLYIYLHDGTITSTPFLTKLPVEIRVYP